MENLSCQKLLIACQNLQLKEVCEWIKDLRLLDGYAGNLARCVNMDDCKLYGMKSHDCHVFMQRLIPIAFRYYLPKGVLEAFTELGNFFRDLCTTELRVEHMEMLEKNIVITLCKLEKILIPCFFDSIEHLTVHLPYKAKVGGPVQYCWMYPFERIMLNLKKKARNKACVEGSICEAYVLQEIPNFCAIYFEPSVQTKFNRVPRQDDGDMWIQMDDSLFSASQADERKISNPRIEEIAYGPIKVVRCYNGFFVNELRFHTFSYGDGKKSMNSGVRVKGSCYGVDELDFYGMEVELHVPTLVSVGADLDIPGVLLGDGPMEEVNLNDITVPRFSDDDQLDEEEYTENDEWEDDDENDNVEVDVDNEEVGFDIHGSGSRASPGTHVTCNQSDSHTLQSWRIVVPPASDSSEAPLGTTRTEESSKVPSIDPRAPRGSAHLEPPHVDLSDRQLIKAISDEPIIGLR
ncbi:Transposon protein, putative, CACTA, En/Spm sub-class [Quillaja saponaria]|uniref:Transposon protein, putative, CACTA, En/Spm sub-class n=1 Tax=Quillaja saponaria TaxID=32244 RepID=A0AAD7PJA2_QUISA|nr:Transposon protein, putative, CACTA, En/Spm sub-class [Quillaja saponaria]